MAQEIERAVGRAWWALVLRGLFAVAIGALIIARPLASVAIFALVIAIWAVVDGLTSIVHAFELKPFVRQWWLMLLGGFISLVFGIAALDFYPVLSLEFAVVWTSWWLLLTGGVAIYVAFEQSKLHLPWGSSAALGVVSVIAGVYALVEPPATLAAIMALLSGFAIAAGLILLYGAFKLKSAQHDVQRVIGAAN
jgi:uncharacterized membrane protein HdeD (DUF308 family)